MLILLMATVLLCAVLSVACVVADRDPSACPCPDPAACDPCLIRAAQLKLDRERNAGAFDSAEALR